MESCLAQEYVKLAAGPSLEIRKNRVFSVQIPIFPRQESVQKDVKTLKVHQFTACVCVCPVLCFYARVCQHFAFLQESKYKFRNSVPFERNFATSFLFDRNGCFALHQSFCLHSNFSELIFDQTKPTRKLESPKECLRSCDEDEVRFQNEMLLMYQGLIWPN